VERQDLIRKADVGLDLARALVEAARAEADRLGLAIAAAVVDSGGQLVTSGTSLLSRTDKRNDRDS
jgi:uncharacterized protein GlcG (DUF336 family)